MSTSHLVAATPGPLIIIEDTPRDGQSGLETSLDLLRKVAIGAIAADRVVRLYAPAPTVAMGRSESRLHGFERACQSAVAAGFAPVIRPTGGRAVAYDPSCLVIDIVDTSVAAVDSLQFFRSSADALALTLRGLGVDARIGSVPGEYCPGDFSLNARSAVKLMGTSQRSVKGARLLSGMIALGEIAPLVEVLAAVNTALEFDWIPATFGTMSVEAPNVDRGEIVSAIVSALTSSVTKKREHG